MRKLCNNDYLVEVTMRVAVRRQDAQAVIATTQGCDQDETEQDRVLTAVMGIADEGFFKHGSLVEYESATARCLPDLKAFKDIRTLGKHSRRPAAPKNEPTLESPLTKKHNKGKKISLETADRLFAGLEERLSRLSSYKEFGVSVPLVILFGSYLRREPEVGDIDLAVLTLPKPNHDIRMKELNDARQSGVSYLAELYGPEKEVLQFIKNRSSWLAIHDFSELPKMENVSFKVIRIAPEFQPLVDQLDRNELNGHDFLKAAEDLGMKLRGEVFKRIE